MMLLVDVADVTLDCGRFITEESTIGIKPGEPMPVFIGVGRKDLEGNFEGILFGPTRSEDVGVTIYYSNNSRLHVLRD